MNETGQMYPVDFFTLTPLVRDPDNPQHGIAVDDEKEKDPAVPSCAGQMLTSFLQEWQIIDKLVKDLSFELHLMKNHKSGEGDMILLTCVIAAFDQISEVIRPVLVDFHRRHFACLENQREAFDLPPVVKAYCDAWATRALVGHFVEPIVRSLRAQMGASPHSGNATKIAVMLLSGKLALFQATSKDCYVRQRAISTLMGNGMPLADQWEQVELSAKHMSDLLKTLTPDFGRAVQEAMSEAKREYQGEGADAARIPETIHEEGVEMDPS